MRRTHGAGRLSGRSTHQAVSTPPCGKLFCAICTSSVPVAGSKPHRVGRGTASAGTPFFASSHRGDGAEHQSRRCDIRSHLKEKPFGSGKPEPNKDSSERQATISLPSTPAKRKLSTMRVAAIRGTRGTAQSQRRLGRKSRREAGKPSSTAAAREHVIDFTAKPVDDLSTQAQGRVVRVCQSMFGFDTAGLVVEEFQPDWRRRACFPVITDPNIVIMMVTADGYRRPDLRISLRLGQRFPARSVASACFFGLYALALLPVSFCRHRS